MDTKGIEQFLQSSLQTAKSKRVRQVIEAIQNELTQLKAYGRFDVRRWSSSARRRTRYWLTKDPEHLRLEANPLPQTYNDPADDPELAEKPHWWLKD